MTNLVLCHHKVLKAINAHLKRVGFDNEVGGILYGKRRGEYLEIIGCTFPQRADKKGRYFFIRKDPRHKIILRNAWRMSGDQIDYLGEWHSHPELNATPSITDYGNWKVLQSKQLAPLFFIIVGKKKWWVGITNSKLDTFALSRLEKGKIGIVYG